jgi:hypothetical protein
LALEGGERGPAKSGRGLRPKQPPKARHVLRGDVASLRGRARERVSRVQLAGPRE